MTTSGGLRDWSHHNLHICVEPTEYGQQLRLSTLKDDGIALNVMGLGMGGMAAGDVASNLAIAAMSQLDEDVPGDALVDALRGAVDTANQNLRNAVDANPSLEGMGTTLTGILVSGTKVAMVHVGDSRAYLLRGDEFVQITKDDTYVQMLVDEGRITEEEASVQPQRSLLIRAEAVWDVPDLAILASLIARARQLPPLPSPSDAPRS